MNLTIAHRDSPLEDSLLRDVSTYMVDRGLLIVLFNDGARRNYPLENIRWFGEIIRTPESTRFVGLMDPADPGSPLDDRPLYGGSTNTDLGVDAGQWRRTQDLRANIIDPFDDAGYDPPL